MENEGGNLVSTTESENQNTTSEASGQEDNVIDEKMFSYRLIRPGESYNMGIEPKNIYSNTSINNHVANGSSDGVKSRYISCSKTRDAINRFASYIKPALPFSYDTLSELTKPSSMTIVKYMISQRIRSVPGILDMNLLDDMLVIMLKYYLHHHVKYLFGVLY